MDRAQAAALRLRREGDEIEFLGSVLVYADETVFWLFEGREADVRVASERAGVPFERVLEVRIDGALGLLSNHGHRFGIDLETTTLDSEQLKATQTGSD